MSRALSVLLFSLFILTSCRHEKKTDLITIDVLEGLKTEKEFRLSEIVDRVEFVKLETRPESLLPERSNYLIGEKYIVAYQRSEPAWIKLFDRQGHFLRKIGQEGKGPLEYLNINALQSDPGETYLLVADMNDKLLKFDFQGNVVTQINYQKSFDGSISDIEIKSSSEIFILLDYPILAKNNFCIVREIDGNLHQVDSLYPVRSTALPVKGGYTWGRGDFYLHGANICFRPYSFDTLYEENEGKVLPRFYLPIKTDHLPGPYIIYGIHQGNYSKVSVIHEFPGYLILDANQSDKLYGVLIYNKKSGVLFSLAKYKLPPPYQFPQAQFLNDIDGITNPSRFFKNISNGLLFFSHEVIELKNLVEKDSLGFDHPKFPEKRKEFIEMIKTSKDDDNPILQIFHLKL
jgi:hypothetical protein